MNNQDSQQVIDHHTWPIFAAKVASPANPVDYVEAAVDRLMDNIEDYVIHVKNVRPQFKPTNSVCLIHFMSAEDQMAYQRAYEEYLEFKARVGRGDETIRNPVIEEWVASQKFHQKAEYLRAPNLAQAMYESVKSGKAAVCCVNYKQTIAKAVWLLTDKYKVNRNDISLIWGGDAKYSAITDQKIEDSEIVKILTDAAMGKPVAKSIMKKIRLQLEAKLSGLEDMPKDLGLGIQSRKERQREIDKFQSGKSNYCFFTFKSGGIGLSLHHTDELTKQKVRRKPSGYAFVEDISLIPTKQREVFVGPTYSALEMVQALGRVPRLTSLSNTDQVIVFFAGTVEVKVARKVSMKLKCLRKVVRQREHWEDAIWEHRETQDDKEEVVKDIPLLEEYFRRQEREKEAEAEDNIEVLMGDYSDEDEDEDGEDEKDEN